MKNIRLSCFETNSSSTHSIIINKNSNVYTTITPDENGIIKLTGGDFGWEWRKYNDALTKANYLSIRNEYHDIIKEVIIEHTGCSDVDFSEVNGHIDQQSHNVLNHILSTKNSIKEFIFNEKYWLYTGNDNQCAPCNFYDLNVKYNYEIKFKSLDSFNIFNIDDFSVKLKDIPSFKKIKQILLLMYENIFREFKCKDENDNKHYIIKTAEEFKSYVFAEEGFKTLDNVKHSSFKDIMLRRNMKYEVDVLYKINVFKFEQVYDKKWNFLGYN